MICVPVSKVSGVVLSNTLYRLGKHETLVYVHKIKITSRDWVYHVGLGSTLRYNNNNKTLVLKILGLTMDSQQTIQRPPHICIYIYIYIFFFFYSILNHIIYYLLN